MELKNFIEESLNALQRRYYRLIGGLTVEKLSWQANPHANPIGFIFWHVTRVEDRLVVSFAQGKTDVWVRDGWFERLGIPSETTGLEYPPDQLASFILPGLSEMQAYAEAVRHETLSYLRHLDTDGFDYSPQGTPFPESNLAVSYFQNYTVGQMFCQLIGEANQPLGHVAFILGLRKELKTA